MANLKYPAKNWILSWLVDNPIDTANRTATHAEHEKPQAVLAEQSVNRKMNYTNSNNNEFEKRSNELILTPSFVNQLVTLESLLRWGLWNWIQGDITTCLDLVHRLTELILSRGKFDILINGIDGLRLTQHFTADCQWSDLTCEPKSVYGLSTFLDIIRDQLFLQYGLRAPKGGLEGAALRHSAPLIRRKDAQTEGRAPNLKNNQRTELCQVSLILSQGSIVRYI